MDTSGDNVISLLKDKTVSRVWPAFGLTLYLELGVLDSQGAGEVTLQIRDHWAFLQNDEVVVDGNENSTKEVTSKLSKLDLLTVKKIAIDKEQTNITFSSQVILMIEHQTKNPWSIHIHTENKWFHVPSSGQVKSETE